MSAPITAIYGAGAGLLLLLLSWVVVQARWRYRTGLGTGTEPAMTRAVRVHGNFTEYVPLALALLLLAELSGLPAWFLHAAGAALLVCRVLHAWGLLRNSGRSFGRFYGTAGTWCVLWALSSGLIFATLR